MHVNKVGKCSQIAGPEVNWDKSARAVKQQAMRNVERRG